MPYNELSDPGSLKKLLAKHGFRFDKRLGQNFIVDPSVCPRIAASLGEGGSAALEIGPGVGVLTRELSRVAEKVVAVELDPDLLPVLAQTLDGYGNVTVINADFMKLDLGSFFAEHFAGTQTRVAANIPYSITSPLVKKLLEFASPYSPVSLLTEPAVASMTLMVQKEAGERICAPVGSRKAGALSALVEYYAETEILFDVPASSFMPPPKVDSVVIRLTPRARPPVEVADRDFFFKLIRAAYAQRRKTAVNTLCSLPGVTKDAVAAALGRMGFEPSVRAETLGLDTMAALSDELCKGGVRT